LTILGTLVRATHRFVQRNVLLHHQLGAPTTRPNEPITAGANFGPGMNAAQAGIPMMLTNDQRAIEELRAIYELFPTEDLGDLLNAYSEDLG